MLNLYYIYTHIIKRKERKATMKLNGLIYIYFDTWRKLWFDSPREHYKIKRIGLKIKHLGSHETCSIY